ncbi:hypothetical protein N0B44_26920 [Roseibacterium beibuensis]|uniref:Uncharacterized protein n=1 Tax=[Roseibacterium] beibuensis TaxID=1193142 RepID=A0ABP9LB42_9RHOB|nr:hypothetical protein [Roseibacterium beibuensis]MCS6626560.1 hypothetical protein [Roseibacterium beibuensis]
MADPAPTQRTTRDEKLSALAALLGPDGLARLRATGLGEAGPQPDVDPDRLAWHQNRLLQRLRARLEAAPDRELPRREVPLVTPITKPNPMPPTPAQLRAPMQANSGLDARIATSLDVNRLRDEHPAVIAHVLRQQDRATRVNTLRSLPGHVARAAVRRLRDL